MFRLPRIGLTQALRKMKENKALALIDAARQQQSQGRHDAAIDLARQALGTMPGHGAPLTALAELLTHNHDYWFNPSLEKSLLKDGSLKEAAELWEQARNAGWNGHFLLLQLGHAYTSLGDFSKAAACLREATDIKTREHYPEHHARHGSNGEVRGPDFVIIGGTKCGTTSLYEYMKDHPQVLPAIWKEIEYFRFPERGDDWYLAHFPRMPAGPERFITGEASTCYIGMREAKERMHARFPNAKLIALLRDPVDKAISHVHHDRRLGIESRTAEQALSEELDLLEAMDSPWPLAEEYWKTQCGYVWHGMYAYFIQDWTERFGSDQMLALTSEDLYANPAETLARVYAYLGLQDHRLDHYEVHLPGVYDKSKPEPIRERLARFFAPHNARLADMLGSRLPWARA